MRQRDAAGRRAHRRGGPGMSATAVLVLAGTIACDPSSLLREKQPGLVTEDALDTPAAVAPLMSGMVADFECAMGAYAWVGGLMSDELEDGGLSQGRWNYDRRRPTPTDAYGVSGCPQLAAGVYSPLSTARFTADDLTRRLETFTDAQLPNRQGLIAKAAMYAGFSFVVLGEAMCTAAVNAGPELTRANLQDSAIVRFTAAVAAADRAIAAGEEGADWESLRTAALVGRARAKLNKGDLAGARADALQVPAAGFVWHATYAERTERRENQVWISVVRNKVAGIEPSFRDLDDPRVPVVRDGVGTDQRPYWTSTKYENGGSPIPIASSEEAQLIIAEADAATGNEANAMRIIDDLRARVGVGPYTGGTTPAAVQAAVREERRRELFLEGRRLNDRYRYGTAIAPLVPPEGTPYFPGKGGVYGSARCFPLPAVERDNNPNIP